MQPLAPYIYPEGSDESTTPRHYAPGIWALQGHGYQWKLIHARLRIRCACGFIRLRWINQENIRACFPRRKELGAQGQQPFLFNPGVPWIAQGRTWPSSDVWTTKLSANTGRQKGGPLKLSPGPFSRADWDGIHVDIACRRSLLLLMDTFSHLAELS